MIDVLVGVLGTLLVLGAAVGRSDARAGLTAVAGAALCFAALMDVPSTMAAPPLGVTGGLLSVALLTTNVVTATVTGQRGPRITTARRAAVVGALLAVTMTALVLGVWRVAIGLTDVALLRTLGSLVVTACLDRLLVAPVWARATGSARGDLRAFLIAQGPNLLGSYAVLSLLRAHGVVVVAQFLAAGARTRKARAVG